MAVPVGLDKKGLPMGLQLIGRPWDEAGLLNHAYVLERAAGFVAKPNKPVKASMHVLHQIVLKRSFAPLPKVVWWLPGSPAPMSANPTFTPILLLAARP